MVPRLALGFIASLTAATAQVHALAPAPERPNILIIVADDLGWNDVGYHGSKVRTPVLDALAAESVRLDRHYVFPTCSPTRCALLTGRNPSRFGILGPIGGRSELALPPSTPTLMGLLRDQEYETAISGKWHLGLRREVGPRQYGFTVSYGYFHGQIDPYTHLYKNGDRTWHRDDVFLDEKGHATDLITAEAVRFLEQPRFSPFFLYVCYSVPHTPLVEPEEWVKPYEGVFEQESRRLTAASITHMDAAIGKILAVLDARKLRESTLILFTSDNGGPRSVGASNDYGGKFPAYPELSDNRPLRGWKGGLYEGGIRVPALLQWKGTLSPGVREATISALDWLPTIARLAGVPIRSDELKLDGHDAWPDLTNTAERTTGDARVLYWKTGNELAIRQGKWKLIRDRAGKKPDQLFDVENDPAEAADRVDDQPETLAALREALARQQAMDP